MGVWQKNRRVSCLMIKSKKKEPLTLYTKSLNIAEKRHPQCDEGVFFLKALFFWAL